MSLKYIKGIVKCLQHEKTTVAKHEADLKHSVLILYNRISDWLRHPGKGVNFVDVVLEVSDVIEETTLMRYEMKEDEKKYKEWLMDFYHGEEMQYKVPYGVKNIKELGNKRPNKVKDVAIEIVTKMYREWSRDNRDEAIKNKKLKGDETLTDEIKEAFKGFKEGRLDKEAYTKQVSEAQKR